jgi:DNA-binding XRE family transcriptional regulator
LGESEQAAQRQADAQAVGRRIAQARHEAGWMTQQTLAELLCVCKRSVQSYEAGKTLPYRHVHRLAEIFERPAGWFLYGDEPTDGGGDDDRDDEILKRLDAQDRVLKALSSEIRAVHKVLYAVGTHLTEPSEVNAKAR